MTFPAIPNPTDTYGCLSVLKEITEVLIGIRGVQNKNGDKLDRAVLYREIEGLIANMSTLVTVVSGASGFSLPTEKTIASGEITVSGTNKFRYHTVDTEGDSASDDLTTINGGEAADWLLLKPESGSRTVVCKTGTSLVLGTDFTMDNIADALLFYCISAGVWYPLTKYNGGS